MLPGLSTAVLISRWDNPDGLFDICILGSTYNHIVMAGIANHVRSRSLEDNEMC